jgi:hypothetical protein
MSTNENGSVPENPYAAPTPESMTSQSFSAESLEERHLRAFVGSKAAYYLQKWRPLLEHEGAGAGFNWAAFFLCGLWLGYRKMYMVCLIFFAIILLESIAEELLFVGVLGEVETPAGVGRVVGIVAAVVCGSFGNRWYLSHARRVVSEVHARGLEEQAVAEVLAKRGGTSLGSALGLFLLYLVATVAALVVLEPILNPMAGLTMR